MSPEESAARFVAVARVWGAGWWMSFLVIAVFAIGGLTEQTDLIVVVGVVSYLLGTVRLGPSEGRTDNAQVAETQARPVGAMLYLGAVIVFQCVLAFRSLSSLSDLGAHFRESYFEGEVLGGSILFVLYESFVVPLGIYAVAHWLCRRVSVGLWLAATTCFFCLDALVKAGRFPLYFLLFFLALSRVLGVVRIRIWIYVSAAAVFAFAAMILVLVRQGLDLTSDWGIVWNLVRVGILNYHVMGFYIFQQLSNSAQFVDVFGGGAYTLGFFSYVAALVMRRAGFDLQYPQQDLNIALTKEIDIPDLGTANAFGTNFLPLYLDAGIVGVAVGFFLLGFLVRGGLHKRSGVEAIDVVALFVMIFGLFQPLIMSAYFAVPLVVACIRKVNLMGGRQCPPLHSG